MRAGSRALLAAILAVGPAVPEEPELQTPQPIVLESDKAAGWTIWHGISNIEGAVTWRERSSALHVTSHGGYWKCPRP